MRRGRKRNRFSSEEDVNPMNYISNLSDVMLVLAVGMMLALIVHWNVDISTSGGTMSDTGMTYAADGSGGDADLRGQNAVSFSGDEMEAMDSDNEPDGTGEGMKKLGTVYFDASTGNYYIIEDKAG